MRIKDLLTALAAFNTLVARIAADPVAAFPMLRTIRDICLSDPEPNHYLHYLTGLLGDVMSITSDTATLAQLFDFFVETVEIFRQYYARHRNIPGLTFVVTSSEGQYVSTHIAHHYTLTGATTSPWLEDRVSRALAGGDLDFFTLLVAQELSVLGIEFHAPRLALDTLATFFNSHESAISQEIDTLIQAFLSRMRMHYPDEVDDFLEEQNASQEFRLQIVTNETREKVGEMVGLRSWIFLREDVIHGSSDLRRLYVDLIASAADCRDVQEWLNYGLRKVVNLIYGGEALREPRK